MMTSTRRDILALLVLLALLAVLAAWQFAPAHEVVWQYDEGVNVTKSIMLLDGHDLYHDIWCDQPPLFTFMLAAAMRLVGESVVVGRLLVLAITLVGLVGAYALARRIAGPWSALASVLLLIQLPHLQELSRSVLIGWPAIAAAIVSLALGAAHYDKKHSAWLVASGLTFACSLLIKPLTVPMFPALIWLVWRAEENTSWRRIPWRTLLILAASMAVPALLALAYGRLPFLDQVVGVLLRARSEFDLADNTAELVGYLFDDRWSLCHAGLVLMSLVGIVSLARERRWTWFGLLVAWIVPVAVALFWQTPLRRHEIFLLMPPLAIAAAAGVRNVVATALLWRKSTGGMRARALPGVAALILWAWWLPASVQESGALRQEAFAPPEAAMHQEAIQFLRDQTPPGSTIFSDDPMLAIRSQRNLPPSLAVASFRRYASGDLGDEMFGLTEQLSPSAIVIWRGTFGRIEGYRDWVQANYCLARAYKNDEMIYLPRPDGDAAFAPQQATSAAGVTFLGSKLVRQADEPGGEIVALLYWRADAPIAEDYTMFCHMIEPDGTRIAGHDLRPLDDVLLTSDWAPGTVLAQEVRIQIPASAASGPKLLSVGMYDASGHRLALADGDGNAVPDGQVILDNQPIVQWPPVVTVPSPNQTVDASFGNRVRLLGYDLAPAKASDGHLDLALHWECLAPMALDWTMFVHVVDASGEIIAQKDQQPSGGDRPTRAWRPGEYVEDSYDIELQEGLAPGAYALRIGLYDLQSGARLPAEGSPDVARGDYIVLDGAVILAE